jgi:two-component system nitrogen regulation sensor histidine kinase GlnL
VQWLNPALAEHLHTGPRSALGQPFALWVGDPAFVDQAARALREQRALRWRGVVLRTSPDSAADISLQPLADGLLLEVHVLAEPASTASPLSATLRGFAHEVKNPLAGLRGAAQLLQRRVADDDLKSLAGLVIAEADRLAALADRLLHRDEPARIDSVNIHAVLERLTQLLQAQPNAPTVHADYDPSLPDVPGDSDRLQQLLLNLARNALDAGARVLRLRTRVAHDTRLAGHGARGVLRVDVCDDGAGVPAAVRDSLFEPLVSGRADGTGLGLALAREIAHEHGGELRYRSVPGETVFSLYLPMESPSHA